MKKMNKFFIATVMTVLISSAILSGVAHISEAKKSSQQVATRQSQQVQTQATTNDKKLPTPVVTKRFSGFTSVSAGDDTTISVQWNSVEVATGGGFEDESQNAQVFASRPGGNGWEVLLHNPSSIAIHVQADVLCLKLVPWEKQCGRKDRWSNLLFFSKHDYTA